MMLPIASQLERLEHLMSLARVYTCTSILISAYEVIHIYMDVYVDMGLYTSL